MSYTKQTWQNGDVITAEKLNHMEGGIENAGGNTQPLIIPYTWNNDTELYETETTFGEVRQAFESGRIVLFKYEYEYEEGCQINAVQGVEYELTLTTHNGNIDARNSWSTIVDIDNPPQTLEELDACSITSSQDENGFPEINFD